MSISDQAISSLDLQRERQGDITFSLPAAAPLAEVA